MPDSITYYEQHPPRADLVAALEPIILEMLIDAGTDGFTIPELLRGDSELGQAVRYILTTHPDVLRTSHKRAVARRRPPAQVYIHADPTR